MSVASHLAGPGASDGVPSFFFPFPVSHLHCVCVATSELNGWVSVYTPRTQRSQGKESVPSLVTRAEVPRKTLAGWPSLTPCPGAGQGPGSEKTASPNPARLREGRGEPLSHHGGVA